MGIYNIAMLKLKLEGFILEGVWKKFEYIEKSTEKLFVTFEVSSSQNNECYGLLEYAITQSDYCYRYQGEVLFTDTLWKRNFILPLYINQNINVFTNQIFYTHAVQRHMIQIHSSMIDYRGKGLLFLGPSGIGKTTMAELWNQYREALIINGDMNFVQDTGDEFIGWGTPWHGSSPYCENTSVPVQALIILRQAPENFIRELWGFEKVQLVSNNIIYPTWLENGMELCLETLDHLLTRVPVYELSCRPDEDAVKLTEETIFGK